MTSPVTRDVLQRRMRSLAVATIQMTSELPPTRAADVIGRQLVRSVTSVAANYRSARRARSRRDFIAKMGIVEEEADESSFWLDLLVEARLVPSAQIAALRDEANQLVAITVASIRTARRAGPAVPRSAFPVGRF